MSRLDVARDGARLSVGQHGDAAAFRRQGLGWALLATPTLGVSSFWARSAARRRLWGVTDLEHDPLDYGGGGGELLAGFAIKWAVIGACLAGAGLCIFRLGAWGAAPAVLLLAAAVCARGFARFVGFVYLASRTTWRGHVFEVEGSPLGFAGRELRDALLVLATLGWWSPMAARARAAGLWGAVRHPRGRLDYDAAFAARRPIYSAFAIGWFASATILALAGGVAAGLAGDLAPSAAQVWDGRASGAQIAGLAAGLAGLWLVARAAWAPYEHALQAATAAGFGLRLRGEDRSAFGPALVDGAVLLFSFGTMAQWVRARRSARLFAALPPAGAAPMRRYLERLAASLAELPMAPPTRPAAPFAPAQAGPDQVRRRRQGAG